MPKWHIAYALSSAENGRSCVRESLGEAGRSQVSTIADDPGNARVGPVLPDSLIACDA